jgi:hypothetical protein
MDPNDTRIFIHVIQKIGRTFYTPKPLFTLLEGIGRDYSESRKIPHNPFTTLGFAEVIPRYSHKPSHTLVLLVNKKKTFYHTSEFFKKSI